MRKLCLFPPFFLCFLITTSIFAGFGPVFAGGSNYHIYVKKLGDTDWNLNNASVVLRDYWGSNWSYSWFQEKSYQGFYENDTPTFGLYYEHLFIFGVPGYDNIEYNINGGDGHKYFVMTPSGSGVDSGSWDRIIYDTHGWVFLNDTFLSPRQDFGGFTAGTANGPAYVRFEKDIANFSSLGGFWQNATFISPFKCDFAWDLSGDRYIELNWTWMHGGEFFTFYAFIHIHDDFLHVNNYKDMRFRIISNSSLYGYKEQDWIGSANGNLVWLMGGGVGGYTSVAAGGSLAVYFDALNSTALNVTSTTFNPDKGYSYRCLNLSSGNAFGSGFLTDGLLTFSAKFSGGDGVTDLGLAYEFVSGTPVGIDVPYSIPDNAGWGSFSNWLNGVFGPVFSLLPESVRNIITQTSGWLSTLGTILVALWSVLLAILPMAPLLLVFWVVDAGVTSVHQGSFEPIGNVATTVFGLVSGLVSTVVGIGSAIWNFIHFW